MSATKRFLAEVVEDIMRERGIRLDDVDAFLSIQAEVMLGDI